MYHIIKAEEKVLFVHYSKDIVPVSDANTGESSQAVLFFAVFGASHYTYAEAQAIKDLPSWIGGHTRAFTFFGGVPKTIAPLVFKQKGRIPGWYDPRSNKTYEDMAEYFGLSILLPKEERFSSVIEEKVKTEIVNSEQRILVHLYNKTFPSLVGLNRTIRSLIYQLNNCNMENGKKSRFEMFEILDRPFLRPLPSQPYQFATYKTARVNVDYHVSYLKHFYSVPFSFVGEEVLISASEGLIKIYHASQKAPVAAHIFSSMPGRYSTQSDHMPPQHKNAGGWTGDRLLRWAVSIGPQTAQIIQALLSRRQHPEQAFRTCLSILSLSNQYSHSQMESACREARETKILNCRSVKAALEIISSTSSDINKK